MDVRERPEQASMQNSQDSNVLKNMQVMASTGNTQNEMISVATPEVMIKTGDSSRFSNNVVPPNIHGEGMPVLGFDPAPLPKPQKRLSPLLDNKEKERAWNLGQSLDSKKVTSALGYLDLKQICYCLAQALSKHIEFSKGHFFLDDLKKFNQYQMANDQDIEFSYNMGGMKIDIDALKKNAQMKKQ